MNMVRATGLYRAGLIGGEPNLARGMSQDGRIGSIATFAFGKMPV